MVGSFCGSPPAAATTIGSAGAPARTERPTLDALCACPLHANATLRGASDGVGAPVLNGGGDDAPPWHAASAADATRALRRRRFTWTSLALCADVAATVATHAYRTLTKSYRGRVRPARNRRANVRIAQKEVSHADAALAP